MVLRNRFLGSILLVAGTTIGVGLLGLPVTTGFLGVFPSICLFFICWLFMLLSGFFFVELSCSLKKEVNLITMTDRTLGLFGKSIAWVSYLLLLYSLMAAYISASAPLFVSLFPSLSPSFAKCLLPLLFGGFIYLGTKKVDWINQSLTIGLILSYLMLIIYLPAYVERKNLLHMSWKPIMYAAPFVLTSFGYHIIIPSLASYLSYEKKTLYQTIFIGSLIALIVNGLWQFLVLGTLPLSGPCGLAKAWLDKLSVTIPLANKISSPFLQMGIYLFSFFSIITSFLGVGLSLSHFLKDGFKIANTKKGRLSTMILTFAPPMLFVFVYQKGFLLALEYAGVFVSILLILLPSLMMWRNQHFQTVTRKALLIAVILFSLSIILISFLIQFKVFDPLFTSYV